MSSETSRGPHRLIKQGAKLVEGVEDILEELLPQLEGVMQTVRDEQSGTEAPLIPTLGVDEEALYNHISLEPITLDELLSHGISTPSEVMSLLLSLEMKGLIRQLAGSQYIRSAIR